jgi:hypothetical protein
MTFYSVVRRRRDIAKNFKDQYEVVSFYDSENHFRGQATFTDRKNAEAYLLLYRHRVEKRNQQSNGNNKVTTDLKIVKSDDMPKLPIPVNF